LRYARFCGISILVIILFTDFGLEGPYVGQMKAVLHREAPGVPIIDLFSDAPAHKPKAAAYLLAAYHKEFPADSVFLCVVDPGVGSARGAIMVQAEGRWFVGPDNGLFDIVGRRARHARWWDIAWQPEHVSASFHGRDIFAPVAARLACGGTPPGEQRKRGSKVVAGWPDELPELVYIDSFGNAMTGIRASMVRDDSVLVIRNVALRRARTFSDVPVGKAFWYENANGLVEIAVNRGSAKQTLKLEVGDVVSGFEFVEPC